MFNSYQAAGSLFPEMTWLQQQLEDLLHPAGASGIRAQARGSFPTVNVGATPDAIEVIAFVPGIEPEAIAITVERGLLSVSGDRPVDASHRQSGTNVYAAERFAGKFRRVIALPEDADPARVEAKLRDGILHVSVAKKESSKPRQITVS